MNMLLLLVAVSLIGIAILLIAGICVLLYFLYKKHEENKYEKETIDDEE